LEETSNKSMKAKVLRALRGAVCTANTKEAITEGTIELYDRLLAANSLAEADLVSLFFSITADLEAHNPAAALRLSGRAGEAAMMVFQEAAVQDSLPGTIRLLLHCYMDGEEPAKHVYIRGAEKLRPDRAGTGT
jgi:chorismate mutase